MSVVESWTAETACRLQAALRLTNEAFANKLGIASRTVAYWHAHLDSEPRAEMQRILDTVLLQAPEDAQARFDLRRRADVRAQALRVALAIVVRDDTVLLVRRRNDESGLAWQFPAGVIKPGVSADQVALQETLSETGIHAVVARHLGSRVHPLTGVICEYFLCDYLSGQVANHDIVENMDVAWAPRSAVTRFIPAGQIFPPALAALEEAK